MTKSIDIVCNLRTPEITAKLPPAFWNLTGDASWKNLRILEEIKKGITIEEMLKRMDEAGVEMALLIATQTNEFRIYPEEVYRATKEYPDRFKGILGVNPLRGMNALKELEEVVSKYEFVGAHIYPHWFKKAPNDAIYFPLYSKCSELDIPIEMQVGHCAQIGLPSVGRPITIDDIAIFFPELKIIGIHTGYPWTEEMISVAWKYPNVFIGIDAYAPKYLDPSLVHFMNSHGKDKVMFGTDFPVIDFKRAMREMYDLNLRDESLDLVLRKNAQKVFNL